METKHTPGPWVVDPDSPTDISPADYLSLGIASISHADKAGGRWEFGEQSKANAKLIAAAPKMLAALIKLHDSLKQLNDCGDVGQMVADYVDIAQAAIAEATA
ncbi:hypothetical protein HU742_018250 [Pseudomonas sp. SWRI102]|uniref:Uncharacterized protein n=1 Tax=Pseudomonas marvdashtae TaxID=2745500 RepID=A0A923JPG6_9PSED|nr:hypothetical protein [Pseudomonas marvdashtae]MBV4553090.1 hypothetical protein [Pseudomonas marvdashtae]